MNPHRTLTLVDLFCGAGGTSTGAVEAAQDRGFRVKLTAANHDPTSISTHTLNHPEAIHLCTGIQDINPRLLFGFNEIDVLWASPECTHHSQARGGKPINEQSRATAHCIVRWAEAVAPKVILVENVAEFLTWGPLDSHGRPLKRRKGELFRAWFAMMEACGYRGDFREMCAADYGDPTTRVRLFVQFVRGRRRVRWPEPTHAKLGTTSDLFLDIRKPWVPAREIIDWSIEGKSIYDREKPLSPNTMERIYAGLEKVGLRRIKDGKGEAFIITTDHTGGTAAARGVDEPLATVTTKARHIFVEPIIVEMRGTRPSQIANTAYTLDETLGTVTAGGIHHAIVEPFLVQANHGNNAHTCPKKAASRRARMLTEPMPTVTGSREWYLVEPALLPQGGGGVLRPVSEPAPTIHCDGAVSLVEPIIVKYNGTATAAPVSEPLDTVTTKARFALCRPVVIVETTEGRQEYRLDLIYRMLKPHELAAAQGFRSDYKFAGNQEQQIKQIGNAVPRRLARAITAAVLDQ